MYKIYTNASKNKNGIGFFIVTDDNNYRYSLIPNTSIYIAEIYAVYEAVKVSTSLISETFITSAILWVYLHQFEILVQRINLYNIPKNVNEKQISFMWIPSHVGIPGDEKADLIPNKATTF